MHTTEIGDLTLKVGKNTVGLTTDQGEIKKIKEQLAKTSTAAATAADTTAIDALKKTVEALSKKVDAIEAGVKSTDGTITLKADYDAFVKKINAEVATVKTTADTNTKSITDQTALQVKAQKEVTAIDTRVKALEKPAASS